MDLIKKIAGYIFLLLGPVLVGLLVAGAIENIGHGTKDINNPVIWIIIIAIFTPIAIGLMIFGWYAARGEYSSGDT